MPVQVASWILDGVSLVATQKSVNDHLLSVVAQQDCALFRGFTEGHVCKTWDGEPSALFAYWRGTRQEGNNEIASTPERRDHYAHWEKIAFTIKPDVKVAILLNDEFAYPEKRFALAHKVKMIETAQYYDPFAYTQKVHKTETATNKTRAIVSVNHYPTIFSYPEKNKQPAVKDQYQIASNNMQVLVKNSADNQQPPSFKKRVSENIKSRDLVRDSSSAITAPTVTKENLSIKVDVKKEFSYLSPKVGFTKIEKQRPLPGLYFVIGSFRDISNAQILSKTHLKLKADVLAARLDNKLTFRVVVGPFMRVEGPALRRKLHNAGIRDPWAINIKPKDWLNAKISAETQLASMPSKNTIDQK